MATGPACPKQPVLLDGSEGSFNSPNYGPNRRYPNDVQCSWLIDAPGEQVRLIIIIIVAILQNATIEYSSESVCVCVCVCVCVLVSI